VKTRDGDVVRKKTFPGPAAQIGAAAWLIALVWAGVVGIAPPAVVPETAPPGEFSAGRAMTHLRVIAAHPHPVGSPENQKVREYLVAQLESLGLHPEVQEATAVGGGHLIAARVYNIVARKAGAHAGLAVALAAHYDSVPAGPGAGDDGAGVAALLETARALNADSAPLRNAVIFLFTDGEEASLLGARAFVAENPAAKEIGLILNFEGRGDSGPSIMFETSSENGWLIDQLSGAAPYPRAASLSAAIYSQMPNSTDMSIFKQAGLAGLNFGFIGSPGRYHTPEDTPENLDQRSLQHHGSYALALARRFGNLELANHKEPDDIFFNLSIGHSWFVNYPIEWGKPIAIAVALMFVVVTAFGFAGGHLKLSGLTLGVAAFAISSALAWGEPRRWCAASSRCTGAGCPTGLWRKARATAWAPFRWRWR
jgi:Peptidase family M28